MKRSPCGVGCAFAASVLGLALLLAAAMLLLLRYSSRWATPHDGPAPPAFQPFADGIGLTPLLLGAILLVLFGVFALLLPLAFCVCKCGAKGLPLPGFPDLHGIAKILRDIAFALRDGADKIDTANGIVDQARGKLTVESIDFKVWVPRFESKGTITIGPWTGEVFVPAGGDWRSPFNDEAKNALKTFVNDATGKAALDGSSALLREKATLLETQANALENQP